MATAKKTAAKPAAPAVAAKPAAAPAAAKRPAAKAAPAPAPEPVVEAAGEALPVEKGGSLKFLGYAADVPEAEQVLVAEQEYEIVDVTETGNPVVRFENPDFDAKKKETPDKNPKFLEVDCFEGEFEVTAAAPEAAPEVAAPAVAAAGKKAPAKAAAKAPAAAAPAAEEEVVDPDDMPDLDNEDANVLELVSGSNDLIATAQELESQVSSTEYQLGGVLFHIRKDKLHRNLADENGKVIEVYSEKGGFEKFLDDYFQLGYRKAMNLIEIYVNFTLAGIEDPASKVASIGWTKASKIAKHLVQEGANPEELVQLAEENTVTDLVTTLKEQVTVGGTAGEGGQKVKRITFRFRYVEEEGNAIVTTLEKAKEQLGLKSTEEALAHIVTEWATANGGEQATGKAAPRQTAAAGAKPAAKTAAAAPAAAPAAAKPAVRRAPAAAAAA
jgi:hypothetical protein